MVVVNTVSLPYIVIFILPSMFFCHDLAYSKTAFKIQIIVQEPYSTSSFMLDMFSNAIHAVVLIRMHTVYRTHAPKHQSMYVDDMHMFYTHVSIMYEPGSHIYNHMLRAHVFGL